jgi:hypothetical protein
MTLNQLLLEAKATFRDTKNSRDSLILFLFGTLDLSKLTGSTEKFLKDAGKVNSLVSFVAQNVLGKTKAKNGKFTIGDADIKKLAALKFSLNEEKISLFNKYYPKLDTINLMIVTEGQAQKAIETSIDKSKIK